MFLTLMTGEFEIEGFDIIVYSRACSKDKWVTWANGQVIRKMISEMYNGERGGGCNYIFAGMRQRLLTTCICSARVKLYIPGHAVRMWVMWASGYVIRIRESEMYNGGLLRI